MISRSKRAKYFGGALTAVCELMRSYGISKQRAQEEFYAALERGYAVGRMSPSREVRPITRLADVCTRWHLEKEFTDREGNPRPLTWNGKDGSLLKLAKAVSGPNTARQVVRDLISRKLVKEVSKNSWIPKAKIVAPSGLDHAQTLRTATMMGRLIRTIAHNTGLKYRGPVLLEVMAQVPKLPTRDIPEFRRFTKAHGLIFAKTVDDWLESRNILRSKRRRISTREAGIVAFAFHEPSCD
ncbi:MAG TPA: DUF6502 family protein [Steroidobacteraceae bacterium]|nr:DUF6502 family protein [Steroidobacteraceae bacterium]